MRLEYDAVWTLPAFTAALWALGGSGFLALRRLGVPLVIAVYSLYFGQIPIWLAALQAAALFIVSTAGYGVDIKEVLRFFYLPFLFFVGALYGASQLPLALFFCDRASYFVGIALCALVFGALSVVSQKYNFPWKWVEMAIGFSIGLQTVLILT